MKRGCSVRSRREGEHEPFLCGDGRRPRHRSRRGRAAPRGRWQRGRHRARPCRAGVDGGPSRRSPRDRRGRRCGDEAVAEQAADLAQAAGTLAGWVNNAAVFRDASIHSASTREVLDLIALNLDPAVVGCATAIRRFLAAGTGGAIVNVSSHQARRAVAGCLPYVTAKAAIEGLTRALAVDYGPRGVRVNAVALGSIATERYEAFLGRQEPCGGRADRGRDAAAVPDRPSRAPRGGRGGRCAPALGRGELRQRRDRPRRRGAVGASARPEAQDPGPTKTRR